MIYCRSYRSFATGGTPTSFLELIPACLLNPWTGADLGLYNARWRHTRISAGHMWQMLAMSMSDTSFHKDLGQFGGILPRGTGSFWAISSLNQFLSKEFVLGISPYKTHQSLNLSRLIASPTGSNAADRHTRHLRLVTDCIKSNP